MEVKQATEALWWEAKKMGIGSKEWDSDSSVTSWYILKVEQQALQKN